MLICANCGTENPAGSRFCNGCGAPLEAAPPPVETRKTVTILFCDATSSTALGERLDPESLRALMTRYFDVMREVIEFHGGVVEKFIGDAVMAVFGVPAVHEDDALRACRAAVEIRGRLAALDAEVRAERGASVEWRMGINTGEVVAGDATTGQRIITGDAVNVAARLEAAAAPGEILLGSETFDLVRGQASTEAIEPLSLKGKAERVPAWRLTAVTDGVGRGGHVRPMEAPLVGRRRPLRLLEEAFREAVEDRVCTLFTVLGVAGVGKSRLIDEFVGSVGDQAQMAQGRCLAYGHGITYWPVVEAIRSGLGLAEDADRETTMAALRELLAGDAEVTRVEAVIGHLLGLVVEPPAPSEMFWGIRRTFETMARRQPLILVFDDIHWGEATFLDLVDHIADWTRDAPILLIAMARPELLEKRPGWGGGKRSATTVQLEPLSEIESDELVATLLGKADLPEEIRSLISRAAEGNPLFVEELLGKLIDDGFLIESEAGWSAAGDLRELIIPPTIQALMAARLDSLGRDERTVIERASVEGKTFHRGAVTELTPETLRQAVPDRLATLTRMELVRPDQASFVGEEAYRFRHLLIRDAAYQALAKQTRSELHERFAGWLERTAGDRLAEYEEILGYHYEQAFRYRLELGPADDHAHELATKAGTLLAGAARRAGARYDTLATIALLDRVVDLLPVDSADRRYTIARVAWHMYIGGEGERAVALLDATIAEASAAEDERAAGWARMSLLQIKSSTAAVPGEELLSKMEQFRDDFRRIGDRDGADQAELTAAIALFYLGRASEGLRRAEAVRTAPGVSAANRVDAEGSVGAAAVFGSTPTSEAIAFIESMPETANAAGRSIGLGRMLALQGGFDDALARADQAEAGLRELGNQLQLSQVDEVRGLVALIAGRHADARDAYRRSYDAKLVLGDRGFASTTAFLLATAHIALGEWDQAEEFARIAIDTSSADDIASQAGGKATLARVLAQRNDPAAEPLAREAVSIMEATDYLDIHGDTLVHLAAVLRRNGKVDEARTALDRARGLFEEKEASAKVAQVDALIGEWGI